MPGCRAGTANLVTDDTSCHSFELLPFFYIHSAFKSLIMPEVDERTPLVGGSSRPAQEDQNASAFFSGVGRSTANLDVTSFSHTNISSLPALDPNASGFVGAGPAQDIDEDDEDAVPSGIVVTEPPPRADLCK